MKNEFYWVPLTDLCQGGFGITDLPTNVEQAIFFAYQLPVPVPEEKIFPDLADYLSSRQFTEQEKGLCLSFCHCFMTKPYYSLGMSSILVNLPVFYSPLFGHQDVYLEADLKSAYHPLGRGRAFTAFQFLFHEKNVLLRQPDLIWQRLSRLQLDPETNGPAHDLALLIQLIGIRHNIERRDDCYIDNISARPRLKAPELKERMESFPLAVEYLISRVVKKLKSGK